MVKPSYSELGHSEESDSVSTFPKTLLYSIVMNMVTYGYNKIIIWA